MEYVVEHVFDINRFKFWGGAVAVVEDFEDRGKLNVLADMIECAFDSDQQVTDEMINSFVWLNAYDIYEDMYA